MESTARRVPFQQPSTKREVKPMNLSEMKRGAVPLHVEIADLATSNHVGALQPGSKLPPLSVLTDQFGVARMTIRQAMDALEDEGLIERYAGRGTFVRQVDIPAKHTLNMKAQLSQLQAMVSQLEVAVVGNDAPSPCVFIGGRVSPNDAYSLSRQSTFLPC